MEGLDLFTPTVSLDGSSSESSGDSEGEGNSDGDYRGVSVGAGDLWRKGTTRGQRSLEEEEEEEEDPLNVDEVDDDRDFEIEKVN